MLSLCVLWCFIILLRLILTKWSDLFLLVQPSYFLSCYCKQSPYTTKDQWPRLHTRPQSVNLMVKGSPEPFNSHKKKQAMHYWWPFPTDLETLQYFLHWSRVTVVHSFILSVWSLFLSIIISQPSRIMVIHCVHE